MIAESTACRAAAMGGRLAFLDTGLDPARLRVYGGTRPATPADPPAGDLLGEIALTRPAGTLSAATLTLTPAAEGMVLRNGTATWVRVVNGAGETAFDLDASDENGAGEVKFATVQLYAGGGLRLVAATLD